MPGHECDDDARVEPAAQHRSERGTSTSLINAELNRFVEDFKETLCVFLIGERGGWLRRKR